MREFTLFLLVVALGIVLGFGLCVLKLGHDTDVAHASLAKNMGWN